MAVTRLTTNGLTGTKYDIASADNYYMEPIATTLLSSAAADITFSNIPQGYKHLQIRGIVKSANTGTQPAVVMRFNGDTGTNYTRHELAGGGSSASAYGAGSNSWIGYYPSTGTTGSYNANIFGAGVADVLDYANTSKYKTLRLLGGQDTNNTYGYVGLFSGLWMNTAAITSIRIFESSGGNLATYTRFSLYGIKG